MGNTDLIKWIDSVREYIVKEWDEKGIPPTIGQDRDEIIDSFRKLRDYKVRDFIEKDDEGNENVIKNFNCDNQSFCLGSCPNRIFFISSNAFI